MVRTSPTVPTAFGSSVIAAVSQSPRDRWRTGRAPARRSRRRLPEGQGDALADRDGVGDDGHPDVDVFGRAPGEVAHHPRSLLEVDDRHDVRQFTAEGLGAVLADDGEGVDGATPGRLLPLRRGTALGAQRPRI